MQEEHIKVNRRTFIRGSCGKLISKICEECVSEFKIYERNRDRKFCSKRCRKINYIKSLKTIKCSYCKKEMFVTPEAFKKLNDMKRGHCCSRKCSSKNRVIFFKNLHKTEAWKSIHHVENTCVICQRIYITEITKRRKTCGPICKHLLHAMIQSVIMSGSGNSMYGKHHSIETKNKISEKAKLRIGINNPCYGKKRPDAAERMRNGGAIKALRGNKMSMNILETTTLHMIQELNLKFQYCGDGRIIIGGFNPDFIDENNKRIIEVFGEHWHFKLDYIERDKRKLKLYKKLGYKVLILWGKDVVRQEILKQKLIKFNILSLKLLQDKLQSR